MKRRMVLGKEEARSITHVINNAVEAKLKRLRKIICGFDIVDRSLLYDKINTLGVREKHINTMLQIKTNLEQGL